MSLRSLNRFLGRSKVDPNVEKAFEDRQIDRLIAEYNFSSELFEKLSEVKADSFEEYALLAYQIVSAGEEPDVKDDIPWPAEGLPSDVAASDEEKKVA